MIIIPAVSWEKNGVIIYMTAEIMKSIDLDCYV